MAHKIEADERSSNLNVIKQNLITELGFTQADLTEVISVIDHPNPNEGIIDSALMPPLILPVIVTNSEKFVIIPPSIEYPHSDAIEIPTHPGWRQISSPLSESDVEDYIKNLKLGNGTAWEQGLQIEGEKSSPEWKQLVNFLSKYSVPDPNYPNTHPHIPVIPSIIYPPPNLRRTFARYTGDHYTGSPLELIVARRHEESHVVEMMLQPWPTGADNIDGFGHDGAHIFISTLEKYGVILKKSSEINTLLSGMLESKKFPRSYLGEYQAYLGDLIFLIKNQHLNEHFIEHIIEADKIRAKTLWRLKPNRLPKNYFGLVAAYETVRSIPTDKSIQLLNEIYIKMKVST